MMRKCVACPQVFQYLSMRVSKQPTNVGILKVLVRTGSYSNHTQKTSALAGVEGKNLMNQTRWRAESLRWLRPQRQRDWQGPFRLERTGTETYQ